MNPCPCGNLGQKDIKCVCKILEIERHNKKIDEALLDRFQIKISIDRVDLSNFQSNDYDIEMIRTKISNSWDMQKIRYNSNIMTNGNIEFNKINEYFNISKNALKILKNISIANNYSKRKYDNVLKIARTIADYENCQTVDDKHIYEAISYQ